MVAWGLHFANTSRSGWKKSVGKKIAIWANIDSIRLGLHFEAEIGNYFEEIYAWYKRSGPINKRSGFRMMEVFDLYFGYKIPWWNSVNRNPQSKLPDTMQFLRDNFEGDDYQFWKSEIERGLKKGQEEMMEMTTHYLLQAPIMFLLMMNSKYGPPFARAVFSVLHKNPLDDDDTDILIHDQDSDNWGGYKYSELSECPVEERKWYDLLINHSDDVVHWWRQLGLNRECLKCVCVYVGTGGGQSYPCSDPSGSGRALSTA